MRRLALLGGVVALSVPFAAAPAQASAAPASTAKPNCAPAATAVSYSDSLDKVIHNGSTLGGLSDLAWGKRSRSWLSTTDNHGTDPARLWFWRDPENPEVVRDPLILRRADGSAYTGMDSDLEGLAVLANGDFVISSESEPAVRIFGRDGVQKGELPVPGRFAVAPAGEATANATLEGLTITPSGDRIIAAMEGALSSDGDATWHRFLVYDRGRHGAWSLTAQWAYRTQAGNRIAEIQAFDRDALLILEGSWTAATGNQVQLYEVPATRRAENVANVADLSASGVRGLGKRLVADLVTCPTLGATAKQPQANPLMDNYEGMAVERAGRGWSVHLVSDDNFGATQITRVLNVRF